MKNCIVRMLLTCPIVGELLHILPTILKLIHLCSLHIFLWRITTLTQYNHHCQSLKLPANQLLSQSHWEISHPEANPIVYKVEILLWLVVTVLNVK